MKILSNLIFSVLIHILSIFLAQATAQAAIETQWSLITLSPASRSENLDSDELTNKLNKSEQSENQLDNLYFTENERQLTEDLLLRSITSPQSDLRANLTWTEFTPYNISLGAGFGFRRRWTSSLKRSVTSEMQNDNDPQIQTHQNTQTMYLLDPSFWVSPARPLNFFEKLYLNGRGQIFFPISPITRNQYLRLRIGVGNQITYHFGQGPDFDSGPSAFYFHLGVNNQYRFKTYQEHGASWFLEIHPKLELKSSDDLSTWIGMGQRKVFGNSTNKRKEIDVQLGFRWGLSTGWALGASFYTLLETEAQNSIRPLSQNWVSLQIEFLPGFNTSTQFALNEAE